MLFIDFGLKTIKYLLLRTQDIIYENVITLCNESKRNKDSNIILHKDRFKKLVFRNII